MSKPKIEKQLTPEELKKSDQKSKQKGELMCSIMMATLGFISIFIF